MTKHVTQDAPQASGENPFAMRKYSRISRRRFLGGAVAAMAAPLVLPGSVLGNANRAAPSESCKPARNGGPATEHRFLPRVPGLNRNWIDCVKQHQTPVAEVESGARTAAISILGNLGYWYRRRLRFDPDRWRFKDDDQANTWLDYQRRDPWQLPSVQDTLTTVCEAMPDDTVRMLMARILTGRPGFDSDPAPDTSTIDNVAALMA